MMSMSSVSAGAAASGYYKEEGYYKAGSEEGEKASAWFGKAAEEKGLVGTVDDDRFAQLLDGQTPEGNLMGRYVDGERQHRPGLDLTFSASKSASVAALVIGDERVTNAHDEAVRAALTVVEERFVQTRYQKNGEIVRDGGQGIIAGVYRHDTSRALDPNLHSHAVIANMVKNGETPDGTTKYSALTNELIYRNQKLITEIYRSEFEARLEKEGIETSRGQYGEVNVVGIPEKVIEEFSKRRQEILQAMNGKGLENSPENAEKAALATRSIKHKEVDRDALRADWRAEAKAHGLDPDMMAAGRLVQNPNGRDEMSRAERVLSGRYDHAAPVPEVPRDQIREDAGPGPITRAIALVTGVGSDRALSSGDRVPAQSTGPAARAVTQATEHLGERASAWTPEDLTVTAMKLSPAATFSAVELEIAKRIEDKSLLTAKAKDGSELLTTQEGVALDRSILHTWRSTQQTAGLTNKPEGNRTGDGALDAKLHRINSLTEGQKEAVSTSLTGPDRYVAVQGYAGTGKTFMVEKVAHYAAESGYDIKAYGPSHKSVEELKAVVGHGETLAKLVTAERARSTEQSADNGRPDPAQDNSKKVLLVDEASMVSSQDMRTLMDYAERTNAARVVLIGDTKQLDAVAAGSPFAQLQEAGMRTAVMDEIRRQRNDTLKEAVFHALSGEIKDAFVKLQGQVEKVDEPRQEAAARYLALAPADRSETRVLALTNAARAEINAAIRAGLQAEGSISRTETQIAGLTNRQLTGAELADARNFAVGDTVMPMATTKAFGLQKGALYSVAAVDRAENSVTLARVGSDGPGLDVRLDDTFNRRAVGKMMTVYGAQERAISEGDQVRFRITDPRSAVTNGERARITGQRDGIIEATTHDGRNLSLPLSSIAARGMEHDYAATAHAVQGETVDRVIVAMNATERLATQKSFYVEISRARDEAVLLTDNPDQLSRTIERETGVRHNALDSWLDGRLAGARQTAPDYASDRAQSDRITSLSEDRHRDAERAAERDLANGPTHGQDAEKEALKGAEQEASKDVQQRDRDNVKDGQERQLSFFEDPEKRAELRKDIKEIENYAERVRERNKEIER